ncbi:hypothetical protein PHMEG_00023091, partial [Phytophthora megakarya]
TALAIEARFQNKLILKKFATKNSNTKAQRAMWEDTINVFQQRALAERAWDGDGPRKVTVKQFKNKLDAVRAGYKAKKLRMLATGNRTSHGNDSDDDDEEKRRYPKLPVDFYANASAGVLHNSSEEENDTREQKLTCNPAEVNPKYLKKLGDDLVALWPLLGAVFSHRPGCTGEAITETGAPTGISLPTSDSDDNWSQDVRFSDTESCESNSAARRKANAAAKAKKQHAKQSANVTVKRSADAVSDTLRSGFEAIERVFTARHQPIQANTGMLLLVKTLTTSVNEASKTQQATSEALLNSIAGLNQVTANFYNDMAKWMQHISKQQ